MSVRKLLIAGGSHAEIPLINAAKSMGYYVISGGNRPGDLGHQYANESIFFDYSDPAQVRSAFKDAGADFLCAGCNDFAAISCSIVADELSLPGHDSPEICETIHLKDKWRSFATCNGLPSPHAFGCSNMEQVESALATLQFPLMVKPVDLTGGKGIQRVESKRAGLRAAEDAFSISRAKRIVIEEFIVGTRHGFTCFLRDHEVVFHFLDDEIYYSNQYMVAGATAPTSCDKSTADSVIAICEQTSRLLNLKPGLLHVQFIEHLPGTPVIIEVCRRAPGDLYVKLVEYATGVPYAEWIISASVGSSLESVSAAPVKRFVTRHCLMTDRRGVFGGLFFDSKIESQIVDQLIWASIGDQIVDPLTHKFGIVFVEHATSDKAQVESRELNRLLTPLVLPANG